MESAPINLQAPLDRRRALLAKLMAQAGAARGGGLRGGVMGGRGFRNASDLAMAPLPQINLGFHPAHGIIPGGFQGDPNAALTPFAGPPPSWTSFTPPPYPGEPPDIGGGAPAGPAAQPPPFNPAAMPPPNYTGPVRSLTGYDGPVDEPPDPWSVFNRYGSRSRIAI